MISRKDLIKSKEYWIAKIQITLFNEIENYIEKKGITKTEFAKEIGVSKGYISQVLNGNFDHKLSKLVELSMAIGKIPLIKFENFEKCLVLDSVDRISLMDEKYDYFDLENNFTTSKDDNFTVTINATNPWYFEQNKFMGKNDVYFEASNSNILLTSPNYYELTE